LDPIIIFVTAAAGALVGTASGILLLRRNLRPPISDAELTELRSKLLTAEKSLAESSTNVTELNKQLALQKKLVLQGREDQERLQEQLKAQSAQNQEAEARRSAAEQKAQELVTRVVRLTEQCTKLEAQIDQANALTAEKAGRLASVEQEFELSKSRIQELIEVAARLTAESAEIKRLHEQEERCRIELETQLKTEHEKNLSLAGQIQELHNDRLKLEVKVQEEIGSAAKGMELLVLAQEKLSALFKVLSADGQNGALVQASLEAIANTEAELKAEELIQLASASN
jgi:chromosome segregation ATPase